MQRFLRDAVSFSGGLADLYHVVYSGLRRKAIGDRN